MQLFPATLCEPPLAVCHLIAVHLLNVYNESVYSFKTKVKPYNLNSYHEENKLNNLCTLPRRLKRAVACRLPLICRALVRLVVTTSFKH